MFKKKPRSRIVLVTTALLITLTAITVHSIPQISHAISNYVERMRLLIHPSAARAYSYGMEHLDPAKPELHDNVAAEYFFTQAVRLDPSYSLAYQQLARLHFLRSDFSGALTEINKAIHLQGDEYPSAFYIRGLIEGFSGDYASAANDYQHFLALQPKSWAGSNDYAWVLMKAYRYSDAVKALETGLTNYPDNAWLLNSYAIALYESGRKDAAKDAALRAKDAVQKLTPNDWSFANPGNDPAIASEGIQTFKTATLANLDIIIAEKQSTLQ